MLIGLKGEVAGSAGMCPKNNDIVKAFFYLSYQFLRDDYPWLLGNPPKHKTPSQ